jgi:hypothetical protein
MGFIIKQHFFHSSFLELSATLLPTAFGLSPGVSASENDETAVPLSAHRNVKLNSGLS